MSFSGLKFYLRVEKARRGYRMDRIRRSVEASIEERSERSISRPSQVISVAIV